MAKYLVFVLLISVPLTVFAQGDPGGGDEEIDPCYIDIMNNCSNMVVAQEGATHPTCNVACIDWIIFRTCPRSKAVNFKIQNENDNIYHDVRQVVNQEQGRKGKSQIQSPLICARIWDCECTNPALPNCEAKNGRDWAPVESSEDPMTPICP